MIVKVLLGIRQPYSVLDEFHHGFRKLAKDILSFLGRPAPPRMLFERSLTTGALITWFFAPASRKLGHVEVFEPSVNGDISPPALKL
jgi:hypothetical protein